MDPFEPQPQPQPHQQDLLNPRPMPGLPYVVGEVQQQCQELRTLMNAALIGLIALSFAADLFFRKQLMIVRQQIEQQQPNFALAEIEFQRNRDPEIRRFMDELHKYAATHPEFRANVLDRYRVRLAQYFSTGTPGFKPTPIPAGANPGAARPPGQ